MTDTALHLDAAMALLDAYCDLELCGIDSGPARELADQLQAYRTDNGSPQLRATLIRMAPVVSHAWHQLPEDRRDRVSFDFEFCPLAVRWLLTGQSELEQSLVKDGLRLIEDAEGGQPCSG